MAGSNYLDGAAGLYGLPNPLPAGAGEQASAIIDAQIRRPEGLVYVTDKNGNPAYMKGLSPSFTYLIAASISAGANVSVTVTPANVRPDMVGEILILEKDNPDAAEAVIVSSTTGNNVLTFANVQFAHSNSVSSIKADMGMVITEERSLPAKRSILRYSRFPCVAILSLMGRYAYGRRSDQVGGLYQEMNLLAAVQTFGGPPQWLPIAVQQASWSDSTGEVWVPAGMLLAYYSDVKMKYVAGFPAPPDPLVRATASIAISLISTSAYGGSGIKSISAGDTRIQRFGSTNMDEDARRLIAPYMARTFY